MSRHRATAALFIALLLMAALAGCGRDEPPAPLTDIVATDIVATDIVTTYTPTSTDTPRPTITPDPSPTPRPTITPEAPAEETSTETSAETPAEEDPRFELPANVLPRFRMRGELRLLITYNTGETGQESLTLSGARVASDEEFGFDQFFEMTAVRVEAESPQRVAIYQVGQVVATLIDGEWRTNNRTGAGSPFEDNLFNQLLTRLVHPFAEAEDAGVEIVNGVEATHYRIEDPQILVQATKLKMAEGQEIQSSQIDLWVAADGNYVVRYEINARMTDALSFDTQGNQVRTDRDLFWTFEIYDIGADILVDLPEEAPDAVAFNIPGFIEGEFPLPEGAVLKVNIYGEAEIDTELSEEEVVSFYLEVLPRLGWVIQGDFGLYEAQNQELTFTLITAVNEMGHTVVRVKTHRD
jgi:hypothetical protein